ncbi:MAG: hypothetical protein ACXVS6_23540 [Solirubrobacteraceae bacterium]
MKLLISTLVGRRVPVACLAIFVLALGLTACGSSSSSSSSSADPSASTAATARLNLAKCFRAHGLNVPDPSSGAGAAGGGSLFRALRNYSQAQVTKARQACSQYFAQAFRRANISPQQRAQLQQQLVKFAQCMRSHGVNVPDPTFNNNGGGGGPGAGFGFRGGFNSAQRNSPAFQAAAKACQSLRPRFGRGAGGPGSPGAGGGAGATGSGTTGA